MEQKIALITGANSGLGKAVTMVLSKMGIHVVMLCGIGYAEKPLRLRLKKRQERSPR